MDGQDPDLIVEAINKAKAEQGERPAMIVLNTTKGAGVPAIEKMEFNHHINMSPEFSDEAIAHLEKLLEEV